MSEIPPQRSVLSPVVIMLAGVVLLAGSVASFFLVGKRGAGDAGAGASPPYRGVIFEARSPVSGGEAGSRVLVMGSMHVLRPQDHPLPESYDRAFELADAVIFELDLPWIKHWFSSIPRMRMAPLCGSICRQICMIGRVRLQSGRD
ncbi:MAG: TraB/GumN family protein [Verrucomicrobiales bacterium]